MPGNFIGMESIFLSLKYHQQNCLFSWVGERKSFCLIWSSYVLSELIYIKVFQDLFVWRNEKYSNQFLSACHMPGGLPWWLSGKESTYQAGSIAGSGRFPRGGIGNPLQYSCLGNLMDRKEPGRLQSMGSQGVKHDLTTTASSFLKIQHNCIFKIYFWLC